MMKNLSVIIPVYNSQDNLPLLIESLTSVLNNNIEEYEIILVNDGSKDQSRQVIENLLNQYPGIRMFELAKKITDNIMPFFVGLGRRETISFVQWMTIFNILLKRFLYY